MADMTMADLFLDEKTGTYSIKKQSKRGGAKSQRKGATFEGSFKKMCESWKQRKLFKIDKVPTAMRKNPQTGEWFFAAKGIPDFIGHNMKTGGAIAIELKRSSGFGKTERAFHFEKEHQIRYLFDLMQTSLGIGYLLIYDGENDLYLKAPDWTWGKQKVLNIRPAETLKIGWADWDNRLIEAFNSKSV